MRGGRSGAAAAAFVPSAGAHPYAALASSDNDLAAAHSRWLAARGELLRDAGPLSSTALHRLLDALQSRYDILFGQDYALLQALVDALVDARDRADFDARFGAAYSDLAGAFRRWGDGLCNSSQRRSIHSWTRPIGNSFGDRRWRRWRS